MKYIIMCGGTYKKWETPRQLTKVCGEPIVARTIRLLREQGIDDIAISSNNPIFEQFGVPVLNHDNDFIVSKELSSTGYWVHAFYPTDEPVCYMLGDVVYSPQAIKTITETETDDIEFFASAPPFSEDYIKPWAEPFAFKVVNTDHFKHAISLVKQYADMGLFKRHPISWELWQVIQATPLNHINYENYTKINDYTCDIDYEDDAQMIEYILGKSTP